jgi:shikimate dehydrogenase
MPSETNKGRQYAHILADGKGFLESVSSVRAVRALNCVILGAGGAARAMTVELAPAGASRFTIVNRRPDRGVQLANLVRDRTPADATSTVWEGMYRVPVGTDLLVNAASIGLYPATEAQVPVDVETVDSGVIVCDVNPNPPRTRFIRDAQARVPCRGCSRNARKSKCYRPQALVTPIGSTVRYEARTGDTFFLPSD